VSLRVSQYPDSGCDGCDGDVHAQTRVSVDPDSEVTRLHGDTAGTQVATRRCMPSHLHLVGDDDHSRPAPARPTSEDPALRPTCFDDYVGQAEVIANLRQSVRAAKRGGWQLDHMLMAGPAGLGKCLGEGTPVILADGRVLPVEQIVSGDRLMGPDGKARTVTGTTFGRSKLYRIEPIKGEPWICNDAHVLTLVHSASGRIIDIPINEYLAKSPTFKKEHKQFSVGVAEFETRVELPVDPYFLGLWFGDGTKALKTLSNDSHVISKVEISKPDPEVLAACQVIASQWGMFIRTYDQDRCPRHSFVSQTGTGGQPDNRLLKTLRDLVGPKVMIPAAYKVCRREDRLQFLAGLLDTDGELVSDATFVITQKREDWARDIWWIARSLGFLATIRPREAGYRRSDDTRYSAAYWVVTIGGDTDQIPTRLARKKAHERQARVVATRTGFAVSDLGEGDYYGFTLDGDGRFLLGDFTVTHNTSLAVVVAAELGTKLHVTSAPAIEHKGALASLLTTLADGDVLFVDEIHALDRKLAETIYAALEDRVIDLPAGKRVIRVPLPKFTLLGATTHAGKLPKPLLDRFGFVWQLRPYTLPEMATIVARSAHKLGVAIDGDGAETIARASRGTPRIANRLLRRVRDVAANAAADGALVVGGLEDMTCASGTVNGALAAAALSQLGIDHLGLDALDRRYLAVVAERPVGLEAICAELGEDKSTIEDAIEPFLVQAGLVKRGSKGRLATEAGREHLAEVAS